MANGIITPAPKAANPTGRQTLKDWLKKLNNQACVHAKNILRFYITEIHIRHFELCYEGKPIVCWFTESIMQSYAEFIRSKLLPLRKFLLKQLCIRLHCKSLMWCILHQKRDFSDSLHCTLLVTVTNLLSLEPGNIIKIKCLFSSEDLSSSSVIN